MVSRHKDTPEQTRVHLSVYSNKSDMMHSESLIPLKDPSMVYYINKDSLYTRIILI